MKKAFFLCAVLFAFPGPAFAGNENVKMVARDIPLGDRALQSVAKPPLRFNMVGLHWQGSGTVEYRTRTPGGRWSGWHEADADTGPDASSREHARGRWRMGGLDWTGAADRIRFRTTGTVKRLRAYYLWSTPRAPVIRRLSMPGQPSVVARSGWLADEKIVRTTPSYASSIKFAVVHHTAGTNAYSPAQSAAIMRGIQRYHVKANGWNDIGYNFLVDRYGTVYEGRAGGMSRNVIGAHSLGFNTGTVGVALIGNHSRGTPPKAQQDALVKLLSWRLDVAHVDPLAKVTVVSGGNSTFRAGRKVTFRTISGHRDTGPTDCPGRRAYGLLPALAKRVAATGGPKLYFPTVTGAIGKPVRFQARLSGTRSWTVTVVNQAGKQVGRGTGRSAQVDWTWQSAGAGKGPFTWTIEAGPGLRPAKGRLGAAWKAAAPTSPFGGLLTGLVVTPSTLVPDIAGSMLVDVSFRLAEPANVTVKVMNMGGKVTVMPLYAGNLGAGKRSFRWDVGALRNGRYRIVVGVKPAVGARVVQSAEIAVVRLLSDLTVTPAVLSPDGDGIDDTAAIAFTLSQAAYVDISVQQYGVPIATVFSGPLAAGYQWIGWDGTSNGLPLAAGDYTVVVNASSPLGTVSLLSTLTIAAPPPPAP